MHYRKTVRNKIKALFEGNISYASRVVPVHQGRALPVWEMELPLLAFYTLAENSDDENTAPRFYNRDYNLVINIIVEELPDVITDDIIDDIAEQVEAILERDPTLTKIVNDLTMKSTNVTVKENGDRVFTAAAMVYSINTKTPALVEIPDGALEDFNTGNVDIAADGSSTGSIQAEVNLP